MFRGAASSIPTSGCHMKWDRVLVMTNSDELCHAVQRLGRGPSEHCGARCCRS